jgi:D-aspartate ligase
MAVYGSVSVKETLALTVPKTVATAVIVGLDANGLAVARSLAQLHIPSIALAQPGSNTAWDFDACTVVPGSEWSADGLIDDLIAIGKPMPVKAPLLITNDQAVRWISEAREELGQHFEIALPHRRTVDMFLNEARFLRLAMREGWPIPETWMIAGRDDLLAHHAEYLYPCIMKPQVKSDAFRREAPQQSFKIANQRELLQSYDLIARWEKEVVIQEWIEGTDEKIGFCLGYSDRDSIPRAMFSGRKLIQRPLGLGESAISEPASPEWSEQMIRLTREIWTKVGYCGLGSVEFKLRLNTHRPVIMQPTVGCTDLQSELATLNGMNIPAIAYCDLAGLPTPEAPPLHEAVRLMCSPALQQGPGLASIRERVLSVLTGSRPKRKAVAVTTH